MKKFILLLLVAILGLAASAQSTRAYVYLYDGAASDTLGSVATAGISIPSANLVDLIGKHRTQIDTQMLGGASATNYLVNRVETDAIRYSKATDGQYIFPNWAVGGDVNIGGIMGIENPLVATNTLLTGDFSLGTIYEFDGLIIEMKEVGTDALDGLITIYAYMRENLRVQDVDKKAFVKSASISADITAITEPAA